MKIKKLEKHCKCGAVIEFKKEDILLQHQYKITGDFGFIYDYWVDETYIFCPICEEQIILNSVKNIEMTKSLRKKKDKPKKIKKGFWSKLLNRK